MTTEEKNALCEELDKKLYESKTSFLLTAIADEKKLAGPCVTNFYSLPEFYSMVAGLFETAAQALNTDSAKLIEGFSRSFSRILRAQHKENFKNRKKGLDK